MSKRVPSFPFYPDDFIGSTAHYEVEVVGAYIRLLCFQWMNGIIPHDPKKIQGIMSCSKEKFRVIWCDLREKFIRVKGGYLNRRMEHIRDEAIEFQEMASDRGKKGARGRWKKHRSSNARALENGMLNDGSPLPLPSPLPNKEEIKNKGIPPSAGTPQAEFVEGWSALYQSETGKPYKAEGKDFILIAGMIKKFGKEEVVERSKILFQACKMRSLWFTKSGMADFSIGKLSKFWNSLIKEAGKGNNLSAVENWLNKGGSDDRQEEVCKGDADPVREQTEGV